MTAGREGKRGLSIAQLNAIDLLVVGHNDGKVAAMVGVARQTINEWRNNNELFKKELEKVRSATWGASREQIRDKIAGEAAPDHRKGQCLLLMHGKPEEAKRPPRCPQGKTLSEDLHECEGCEVRPSKRKRILINHIPADYQRPQSTR